MLPLEPAREYVNSSPRPAASCALKDEGRFDLETRKTGDRGIERRAARRDAGLASHERCPADAGSFDDRHQATAVRQLIQDRRRRALDCAIEQDDVEWS